MMKNTKGPWYIDEHNNVRVTESDAVVACVRDGDHVNPDIELIPHDEREANGRLIAAAPLLALIADLTGRYTWEALSENFHFDMTRRRKADLLAAYRAYCGYRDGRMTMEEAWAEVSEIAKALNTPTPAG